MPTSSPPSKLTIHPPQATVTTSAQEQLASEAAAAVSASASAKDQDHPSTNAGAASPVAPAFSPITPKAQPTFPAGYPPPSQDASFGAFNSLDSTIQPQTQPQPQPQPQLRHDSAAIAPATYIPQPPPRPFSSEESTDAIALRAAISSLQFQKQKAVEDIRVLEGLRTKALDEPEMFKTELAAGRLKEQKTTAGDLRAILAAADSSDDEEEQEEEDEAMAGADEIATFERIPGPQNVVRMPHINWEKYHIHGEALDRLHEQQRKWPGSSFDYGGQDKGREYTIAAPYSPWLDTLEGQQDGRKDSLAVSGGVVTPTTMSVSEHPMETRRNTSKP